MTLGNMHNNLLKIYVTCISGDRQTDTLITILSSPTDGEAIKCLYRLGLKLVSLVLAAVELPAAAAVKQ